MESLLVVSGAVMEGWSLWLFEFDMLILDVEKMVRAKTRVCFCCLFSCWLQVCKFNER